MRRRPRRRFQIIWAWPRAADATAAALPATVLAVVASLHSALATCAFHVASRRGSAGVAAPHASARAAGALCSSMRPPPLPERPPLGRRLHAVGTAAVPPAAPCTLGNGSLPAPAAAASSGSWPAPATRPCRAPPFSLAAASSAAPQPVPPPLPRPPRPAASATRRRTRGRVRRRQRGPGARGARGAHANGLLALLAEVLGALAEAAPDRLPARWPRAWHV